MNILTPSIFGCALLLTAGCIVIAPNHGGKRQTESEEVVEMDTSTVKRTIIIEHATSASDPENNTVSSKTVKQTIIINGEEKQQDDRSHCLPRSRKSSKTWGKNKRVMTDTATKGGASGNEMVDADHVIRT